MAFETVSAQMGWPDRHRVFSPETGGARALIRLAKAKIELPLRRAGAEGVNVGLLPNQLDESKTDAPLAVICEFVRAPRPELQKLAHQLAWNFCRTRLLILLAPNFLTAWSCCVAPDQVNEAAVYPKEEGSLKDLFLPIAISKSAENALHWINLSSGAFFAASPNKFRDDQRADHLLLDNLRYVRRALIDGGLGIETCHNLLARLIFVQYLFQRKDSSGKPFMDSALLEKLSVDGVLEIKHESLASILQSKRDTYALFKWLNHKFNGDLFPGGDSDVIQNEELSVCPTKHLKLLASFISGNEQFVSGQRLLWKHYAFDIIPIEFISSVYEEFLSEDERGVSKAYYTPSHLVDFILDSVLPWDGENWDIRVLDPCCGSGIFLVKAFQRLMHRWREAHGRSPDVPTLKNILSRNICGVDRNGEAVRVAAFSLYLALADQIDPRQYWKTMVFPPLRGQNLIECDFFEQVAGIDSNQNANQYDVVVGNAPWGKGAVKTTHEAQEWAKNNGWTTSYKDIGPLFIAKASTLTKEGGKVSLIQAAGLLLNKSGPANTLRTRLLNQFSVEEIINLAALRFSLFPQAVGPSCVFTLRNELPSTRHTIFYICPKETKSGKDSFRVVLEPCDWHEVPQKDALKKPHIWTALAWGSWRDVLVIDRLLELESLDKLRQKGVVFTREGLIRGDRKKRNPLLLNKRIFSASSFKDAPFTALNAGELEINNDPLCHSRDSSDLSAFKAPQLLLKQSWQSKSRRFEAVLVNAVNQDGVICSDSYVTVHSPQKSVLLSTWLVFNSKLAVYFQLLTSGRFAAFIPQPLEQDLRNLPIPHITNSKLSVRSYNKIDAIVGRAFGLNETELALIDDLFDYTLSDFKEGVRSAGRESTNRGKNDDLIRYSQWVVKTLRSSFGNKPLKVTIFQEPGVKKIPVRLFVLHFDWPMCEGEDLVNIIQIPGDELVELLTSLHSKVMTPSLESKGFVYERHLKLYDVFVAKAGDKLEKNIPSLYIIKPDQKRHWTRSQALRDADEIGFDILMRMEWKM